MKKTGFTLAEVLMSLAVVGILAAITIPQVAIVVEKNKSGAIIGRATEQISLSCQNYIQHINDLRQTENNFSGYCDTLTCIESNGQSSYNYSENDLLKFIGLDKPFYTTEEANKYKGDDDISDWWILAKSPTYIKPLEDRHFLIDVNGFGGKNKEDIDRHEFELTDRCKMKPISSMAIEITGNDFREE